MRQPINTVHRLEPTSRPNTMPGDAPPSNISSESGWVNPRVAKDNESLERLEHTEKSVVEDNEVEKIKSKGKPGRKEEVQNRTKFRYRDDTCVRIKNKTTSRRNLSQTIPIDKLIRQMSKTQTAKLLAGANQIHDQLSNLKNSLNLNQNQEAQVSHLNVNESNSKRERSEVSSTNISPDNKKPKTQPGNFENDLFDKN